MHINTKRVELTALFGMLCATSSTIVVAQQPADPTIIVEGTPIEDFATLAKGPEIKGIISARNGDKIKITSTNGASTIIIVTDATQIKTGGGLFAGNRNKLAPNALLNGLPVTVKTLQSGSGLVASQITFRNNDFKTATMIRNGTAQQFDEQTAATEALRGRMGDIDKYNIKGTTNVYFDTGKHMLSPQAKQELCATANTAEATDNALMLVVGYTDSVGSEEYNQTLSEKRASSVINYLQQACRWKPYRMLTPTGMAESDPLASNDTEEGKAQNRRVSVNILVSKGLDGL
ncbi:OmpA family protein [Sphingorhabdus sp. IMCC26285]|jgi:OOP family OmpA-OmpF porin|uniref:OmpA family protein n=1 Tax=Sphingorhabdus profundilacus TaxID=2509718 RepID=A0A6I4LZD6_9SPHN|nr:OmpA family protein [Sphingorhabdus profundilacus]MVZ98381.1 OmpA family protein [Sphingorhabdus profundilacus]